VAKDYAGKFPNNASPYTSTMVFIVRKGNPKAPRDGSPQTRPTRLAGRALPIATLRRPAPALAVEPKVLLLDEPFGALDTKVRQELRRWLRRLHDEGHISSVFVTHDQEAALEEGGSGI
jgi:ABC-type uncharacterized transport system YnjBCD ATPase subunit